MAGLVAVLLFCVAVGIAVVAVDHFQARLRLAELPLDNLHSTAFQAERAVMRVRLAASEHRRGEVDAESVLLLFDVLLSRVPLLREGGIGALIRDAPAAAREVAALAAATAATDAAVAAATDDAGRIAAIEAGLPSIADAATGVAIATITLGAEVRVAFAATLHRNEMHLGGLMMAAIACAIGLFAMLAMQARRLAEQRRAAEAASRAKTTFLANMSHELRTPLNGVIGMLELLADESLPPAARERAAMARGSAEHLLSLIGDILDVTKLEAGRVELERTPFALGEVLRRSVNTFAASAEAKGVALTLDLAPPADRWFFGDPTRLAQIVNNLIANAVKFTAAGEVRVAALLVEERDGQAEVLIRVRDSGIGIAPAALRTLFQKFTQADASMTRRYGGSGLGLAICRELARLMEGTIEIESREGQGTVVRLRVRLPLAAPPAEAAAPATAEPAAPAPPPVAAPRVLLVEDDRTGRIVATAMLRKLGALVSTAETGVEAVAAAAAEPFDLILMDVQMPVMDGLEAAQAIRAGGGPNARSWIVALSANAFREDVERSLAAGMDDHVAKPVSRATLARVLEGAPVPGRAVA